VWYQGTALNLSETQPADGSYIQLDTPIPKDYERIYVDYTFTPIISVVDEDSEVYGTDILRVIAPRFAEKGKTFEGSINAVSEVYNDTKDETYTVTLAQKEFIYLEDMGTWEVDDVLKVDYTYVQPFDFLLSGISARKRYESAYVIDQAEATLVTPYWAQIGPNDLLTALAHEVPAYAVIDPTFTEGNDEIANYFDVSRITHCIDLDGNEYTVGTNLSLYGRNEIKWITAKPTKKYTVHFTYHPTYTALTTYDTARYGENKSFVNRINLMLYDKVSKEVSF